MRECEGGKFHTISPCPMEKSGLRGECVRVDGKWFREWRASPKKK